MGRFEGLFERQIASRTGISRNAIVRYSSWAKEKGLLGGDALPSVAVLDWFEKTTGCDKKCGKCDYYKSVLEKVLVKVGGEI